MNAELMKPTRSTTTASSDRERLRLAPTEPQLPRINRSNGRFDLHAAERAVTDLLAALGQDPAEEGLRETPRSVAAAYQELLSSRPFTLTTFHNDEGYDELIIARSIRFSSQYMHHL